jgi:pimeloyl-ACP methyl ester carboxylesterase
MTHPESRTPSTARDAAATAPRELRIAGAGTTLGLLDYGDPGGAPPVVLLHGIRDLAWSMDSVAQALRDRWHVRSLDLRGHGASDHPGAYSFPYYAADLHRVLEALGIERPIFVGHSLGGQIVAMYAGLFPERARGVVTIEGLGPPRAPAADPVEERRQHGRSAVEALATVDRPPRRMADLDEASARVLANHPRLDPGRARFLAERGTTALPDGGLRWSWDPRVQGTWASTTRMANEERWSWVECPTLVVTGGRAGGFWRDRRGMRDAEDGGMAPEELARRLACFRHARHVEIAGAGHMVHFDAPGELNLAIVDFLATLAD